MTTKSLIFGIIGIIIIGGGIFFYQSWNKYAPTTYVTDSGTTVDTTTGATSTQTPTFTMAEVATHKDQSSCYSVIQSKVYDLTLWINMHPGGKDKILSICGIDGTQAFMNQHHGAQKQMDILSRFRIGTLAS